VPVPRVIAAGYDDRLVVEQLVDGVNATDLHRDGRLDLTGVLDVVRQLHRVTTTLGGAGRVETVLTADAAISEALDALDAIAVIAPTLADEVMRVAVTLRTAPRPPVATVRLHGDLHLDQFLVDGDRVTVVDLERSRLGAPGYDLGCLAGHLVELACRPGHHPAAGRIIDSVASNWQAVGGNPDDLHPVFACTGLVRRALLAVRSFDHRLPDLAASLLHAAATVIEAPRFVTLHLRPKGDWSAVIRTDEGTARAVLGTGGITMVDAAGDSALVGLETAQHRGQLVAHRPGRRAVIASRSGSYLKVTPPNRAAQLADRHRLVHDRLRDIDDIRSPSVISFDADLGILELEGMTGTPLVDTLASDSAAARHHAIARTASVLAALSGLDLAAGDVDTLPHLPIAGDGGSTSQWAAVAGGLYPSLAALHRPAVEQIDTLFSRYQQQAVPGRVTFSHGDFHDKNLFLADDHAAIIDLDAAGVGDPLVDQGNLIAHVELRGLQRGESTDNARADAAFLLDVLGQVASHAYASVDDYLAAVRLHTARTLHRLSVVYRCRARWAHLAPELLNESWHWASVAAAHSSLAPPRPR
jgi:aminoglycoside phosphotransferase (APT) family kinase protein